MDFNKMKFIDHVIGKPTCLMISIYDMFFNSSKNNKKNEDIKKILLIKYFGLGSIILITPAIKALKKKYPQAKITFLTFSGNKELCEMIDEIDKGLYLKLTTISRLFKDVSNLFIKIREEKFDLVYNFEFHARFPAITAYISGAPHINEFHSDSFYKGKLKSQKVPFTVHEHVTKSFLNLVGDYKSEDIPEPSKLNIPYDVQLNMWKVLKGLSDFEIKRDLLIGVNINASDMALERRWPRGYFAELLSMIKNDFRVIIFLVGSAGEAEYVESMITMLSDKSDLYNLAGKLSIKLLAAFFKICDLVISNDSGPLHIAEAVGTSTISFFGPETPAHYGPRGNNHMIFFNNTACSPCLSPLNMKTVNCTLDNICMTNILPSDVYKKVKEMLKNKSNSKT